MEQDVGFLAHVAKTLAFVKSKMPHFIGK